MTAIPSINSNRSSGFIPHILTHFISSHVLSGLCKIAGYEILRHGTSLSNYKSIIENGANPNHDEKATAALGWKTNNKFYVFRDSTVDAKATSFTHYTMIFQKRSGPVIHSCINYMDKNLRLTSIFSTKIIASLAKGLFTPKLKFIYSQKEIETTFKNDTDYGGIAYHTDQVLPSDRIGLIGFTNHVDKKRVWSHIKSNPGRVALGVLQLAVGILFTATGLGLLT